ncbi:hypothetical protein FH972_026618 [Carpinus fangiana]|uniref:CN hydrolase domain-containing protein n=1 Tax=Carpinus fangiana TaxID=176857 RepID=A0A5N6L4X3_9ROSI|nr:hypothetical protein FH972_026618 [Carpinus fangiana]
MGSSSIRVAVTQHEPVWLDLEGAVQKTCDLIREAASGGAQLIAFPELWIPGYPAWIWSRPFDFDLGIRYVQNSLAISSAHMDTIRAAAAANKIQVSLGFSENDAYSVYIAQALIGADGDIKMRRRKMKPTHMERTMFGDASGECLTNVVDTPIGKVGSLACWEHIQPLLKYHTLAQKEQIHVAAWPVLDPFIEGSPGFWSMSTEVFGPDGRQLTASDAPNEQLIFADIDLASIIKTKTFADASGHYSRPDLLWLGCDLALKKMVRSSGAAKALQDEPADEKDNEA